MFEFFNKTKSIKPTTNSNPPKPKIKKVKVDDIESSVCTPIAIDNVYRIIHDNSEYIKRLILFLLFNKKIIKVDQNIIEKKSIHINIQFIVQQFLSYRN